MVDEYLLHDETSSLRLCHETNLARRLASCKKLDGASHQMLLVANRGLVFWPEGGRLNRAPRAMKLDTI